MPGPALLLLISTLLPLAGVGILLAIGRRLGSPLAGWVATFFSCVGFALSLWAMVAWYDPMGGHYQGTEWALGSHPILLTLPWIPIGHGIQQDHAGFLDVGIYLDSLTIALFATITLVACLIHVFSIGYFRDAKHASRPFVALGLCCFAVQAIVLSATLLQIMVFWEILAASAYLLIGTSAEPVGQREPALRLFITCRLADVAFFVALGLLITQVGNLTLPHLWAILGNVDRGGGAITWSNATAIALPDGRMLGPGLMTMIGTLLVVTAFATAGQVPLHGWLVDAARSSAPAGALFQSVANVTAAVYLLARVYPIFTPRVHLILVIVGLIAMVVGALAALAQRDLPRLLAYATVSQVGLIFLALGAASWVSGLFYLVTHAFFKSLLLLSAGGIVWAMRGRTTFDALGGMWRKAPWTALAFALAVLTAAAMPGFAGYYSTSRVLGDAAAMATLASTIGGQSRLHWLLFIVPVAVVYLTGFYLARCWMLTFLGQPRDRETFEVAHETPILWTPLILLAPIAVFAGTMLGIPSLLHASVSESQSIARELRDRNAFYAGSEPFSGFESRWPDAQGAPSAVGAAGTDSPESMADVPAKDFTAAAYAHEHGALLAGRWWIKWAPALGMLLAIVLYWPGHALAPRMLRIRPARWLNAWLSRGMFFDELCDLLLVRPTALCAIAAAGLDTYVMNGPVNLVLWLTQRRGRARIASKRSLRGDGPRRPDAQT
jgi:NADH:ubiquinone oxidoreductase subunit 5 (subunit L)/multisubunit Na+/H+ antiporter MnhA subunit